MYVALVLQMVTQKLPPRTCPDVLAAFEDHDGMSASAAVFSVALC